MLDSVRAPEHSIEDGCHLCNLPYEMILCWFSLVVAGETTLHQTDCWPKSREDVNYRKIGIDCPVAVPARQGTYFGMASNRYEWKTYSQWSANR